jgi:hypothetical protein
MPRGKDDGSALLTGHPERILAEFKDHSPRRRECAEHPIANPPAAPYALLPGLSSSGGNPVSRDTRPAPPPALMQ